METRNDLPLGWAAHTEIRDGMLIEWDVSIPMDDGVVLRADVFRPIAEGRFPVIMTYGPYAKGLAFQEGYPTAWELMAGDHPDVTAGSSNIYQNWEVVDPEKWVPDGYGVIRVDSRGAGKSPGRIDCWSPRESRDYHDCIEWAARQPWATRKGRAKRNFLLRDQSMAGRASLRPPSHWPPCALLGGRL